MAGSMERLGRAWFEGIFWLCIGIGEPFLAPLVKYLYCRALPCRTNTIDRTVRTREAKVGRDVVQAHLGCGGGARNNNAMVLR